MITSKLRDFVARGLVPRPCAEDKPRRYGMGIFCGRKREHEAKASHYEVIMESRDKSRFRSIHVVRPFRVVHPHPTRG